MVPSTTDCDTSASSVVSDGSPLVRNWAPRRRVESQVSRQPIMVLATGSLSSKKWLEREKKPGTELEKRSAKSALAIHSTSFRAASLLGLAALMPIPMSV
ncbi:hypothetical protein D3C86_1809710 [compost metagenome]